MDHTTLRRYLNAKGSILYLHTIEERTGAIVYVLIVDALEGCCPGWKTLYVTETTRFGE